MAKPRPCLICGPLGTQKDGYTLGHTATCSPALRSLVRAALAWEKATEGIDLSLDGIAEDALHNAVARFRASREKEGVKRG